MSGDEKFEVVLRRSGEGRGDEKLEFVLSGEGNGDEKFEVMFIGGEVAGVVVLIDGEASSDEELKVVFISGEVAGNEEFEVVLVLGGGEVEGANNNEEFEVVFNGGEMKGSVEESCEAAFVGSEVAFARGLVGEDKLEDVLEGNSEGEDFKELAAAAVVLLGVGVGARVKGREEEFEVTLVVGNEEREADGEFKVRILEDAAEELEVVFMEEGVLVGEAKGDEKFEKEGMLAGKSDGVVFARGAEESVLLVGEAKGREVEFGIVAVEVVFMMGAVQFCPGEELVVLLSLAPTQARRRRRRRNKGSAKCRLFMELEVEVALLSGQFHYISVTEITSHFSNSVPRKLESLIISKMENRVGHNRG